MARQNHRRGTWDGNTNSFKVYSFKDVLLTEDNVPEISQSTQNVLTLANGSSASIHGTFSPKGVLRFCQERFMVEGTFS